MARKNPQITNEQIISIAQRNGGGITVDRRYRNDQFRRRLKRMAHKGVFKYRHYPAYDEFILAGPKDQLT